MTEKRLFSKLDIKNGEILVFRNQFLNKFLNFMFYPLVILSIVFSFVIIDYFDSFLSLFIIPILLSYVMFYKFVFLKWHLTEDKYVLKVNEHDIIYNDLDLSFVIPINQIISIIDNSFCDDSKGTIDWVHSFTIAIKNGSEYLSSVKKKYLEFYKYDKINNVVKVEVPEIGLFHDDYIILINYIKEYVKKINSER